MRATQQKPSAFRAFAGPLTGRAGRTVSSFSKRCRSHSQSRTGEERAAWLGSQGTPQEYNP
jgi:hypothetical protein